MYLNNTDVRLITIHSYWLIIDILNNRFEFKSLIDH